MGPQPLFAYAGVIQASHGLVAIDYSPVLRRLADCTGNALMLEISES